MAETNHSQSFFRKRETALARTHLLTNLLLSRLAKLKNSRQGGSSSARSERKTGGLQRTLSDSSMSDILVGSSASSFMLQATSGLLLKTAEQEIVPWEADNAADCCRICNARFQPLSNRKHHCRLCGRLVCRSCLDWLPFSPNVDVTEKNSKYLHAVKSCSECIFKVRRIWKIESGQLLPANARIDELLRIDSRVKPLKQQIGQILPQFNQLLWSIEQKRRAQNVYTNNGNTALASDADFVYAQRYRKSLVSMFLVLDKFAKQLRREMAAQDITSTTKRVYIAYHGSLLSYLQEHMFTLNFLPNPYASNNSENSIQVITFAELTSKSSSTRLVPIVTPPNLSQTATSALREFSRLTEVMGVLQTQFVELQSQERQALRSRKLEDASTLRFELCELQLEISRVSDELAKLSN